MDPIIQLHARNAALETELRLVKEHLAQANRATTYLLTIISNQQGQHERTAVDLLQSRLDEALVENVQLRARLSVRSRLAGNARAGRIVSGGRRRVLVQHLNSSLPPSPALSGELREASQSLGSVEDSDDLLSFEDSGTGTPAAGLNGRTVVRGRRADVSYPSHSSLMDTPPLAILRKSALHAYAADGTEYRVRGLDNTGLTAEQQSTTVDDLQHSSSRPPNVDEGHVIHHSDGTTSFVSITPPSSFSPPPHAPTGPRQARRNFLPFERAYLIGLAGWIEDLDDEQYVAKWEEVADSGKCRGRHSADEWREYYERVIQPSYLNKAEVEKQEPVAVEEAAEGVTLEGKGAEAEVVAAVAEQGDHTALGGECETGNEAETRDDVADLENCDSEANEQSGMATIIAEDPFIKAPEGIRPAIDEIRNDDQREGEVAVDWLGIKASPRTHVMLSMTDNPRETLATRMPSPRDIRIDATSEGLAASRWAPGPVHIGDATPEIAEPIATTSLEASIPNLLSIEEFCAAEQRIQLSAATTTTDPPASRDSANLLGAGAIAMQRPHDPRSRCGNVRVRRGGGRGGNAEVRLPQDSRPPCCHWPFDIADLHHGTYPHDPSVLRTVMITNIPPTVTLAGVLDRVHSGKILCSTYLELSKMKLARYGLPMRYNAVMITFLYAGDARSKDNVCFDADESDSLFEPVTATITHLPAVRPAPSTPSVQHIRSEGLSRAIYLIDKGTKSPAAVMSAVLSLLAQRCARGHGYESVRYPERMGRDADGVLFFEFAGIEDAVIVKRTIDALSAEFGWEYGGLVSGFLPDPCEVRARPAASLQAKDAADDVDAGAEQRDEVVKMGLVEAHAAHYILSPPTTSAELVTSGVTASDPPTAAAVPRTGWSTGGHAERQRQVEEARAFMASATRGGEKRNRRSGREVGRSDYAVDTMVGAVGYDVAREEDVFGYEG
ncbi:hypothetical protein LTR53_003927 [Teratosphaeriaceae sp. CCFEE 6253]|nr:hypothetical protein LTR53_003927 [Teratosphaeriaceae sp. CCFEE 6253]